VFVSTAFLDPGTLPVRGWALVGSVPPVYRPIGAISVAEAPRLVTLGAHTHTHGDFRGRASEFRVDLADSLRQLDVRFGRRSWPLALPFGHADEALVDAARTAGVTCALTTRAELIEPDADPFSWGRFNVYQSDVGATLEAKLQGWYSWLPNLGARMTFRPAGNRAGAAGRCA
jgi:hypothetical protein